MVTALPVHYAGPFFAYLSHREELELTVLYGSMIGTDANPEAGQFGRPVVWDANVLRGYRYKTFQNPVASDSRRRWSVLAPGVARELSPRRYDVVVNFGWAYPYNWLGQLTARAHGLPVLLYTDTDVRDRGSTRVPVARTASLTAFLATCSGALYTGTFNRDFYIRHGMAPERLWFSPWAVQNERFGNEDRHQARGELDLRPNVIYYLFVGALAARKNVEALLRAVSGMQQRSHPVGLILAGSGPREEALRSEAVRLGLRDVHWLGFVTQGELPRIYSAADVFVLPSWRDARATVVNEAMASGLPVVVSSGTGVWGPGDLMRHGSDGLVFDVTDESALELACTALLDFDLRRQLGSQGLVRVRQWSYDTAARGWIAAASALGSPTRRGRRANAEHIDTDRITPPLPCSMGHPTLDP